MQQPKPQALMDVPGELFEKYLRASGEEFGSLPQAPNQAQIQEKLLAAAKRVGVDGPHAQVLALRYSFFVTVITKHQAELLKRGWLSGEAGLGKSTTFSPAFIAACARLPVRFLPTTGFIFDPEKLWALVAACEKAYGAPAPAPEPKVG